MPGSGVSASEERDFEKRHISAQRGKYLATDVLQRTRQDSGYREKIAMIEAALNKTEGWVLDFGANTCGEAEVLSSRGYSMIAMDINEVALSISKERVQRYERKGPRYVAGDGHRIPLDTESITFVICFEVLHHMENPSRSLEEISRVLVPDGELFLFEPYAFNPYRRLSELRDKLKGTIEKSFGEKELIRLLTDNGLKPTYVNRSVLPPSEWRKRDLSRIRRTLRDAYFTVARRIPKVFGNLTSIANKPGISRNEAEGSQQASFESILRCPVSGASIVPVSSGFLSTDEDSRLLYPSYKGIPVLIAEDAVPLDPSAWRDAFRQANGESLK